MAYSAHGVYSAWRALGIYLGVYRVEGPEGTVLEGDVAHFSGGGVEDLDLGPEGA